MPLRRTSKGTEHSWWVDDCRSRPARSSPQKASKQNSSAPPARITVWLPYAMRSVAYPRAINPDVAPVETVELIPLSLCQIAVCPAAELITVLAKSKGLAQDG